MLVRPITGERQKAFTVWFRLTANQYIGRIPPGVLRGWQAGVTARSVVGFFVGLTADHCNQRGCSMKASARAIFVALLVVVMLAVPSRSRSQYKESYCGTVVLEQISQNHFCLFFREEGRLMPESWEISYGPLTDRTGRVLVENAESHVGERWRIWGPRFGPAPGDRGPCESPDRDALVGMDRYEVVANCNPPSVMCGQFEMLVGAGVHILFHWEKEGIAFDLNLDDGRVLDKIHSSLGESESFDGRYAIIYDASLDEWGRLADVSRIEWVDSCSMTQTPSPPPTATRRPPPTTAAAPPTATRVPATSTPIPTPPPAATSPPPADGRPADYGVRLANFALGGDSPNFLQPAQASVLESTPLWIRVSRDVGKGPERETAIMEYVVDVVVKDSRAAQVEYQRYLEDSPLAIALKPGESVTAKVDILLLSPVPQGRLEVALIPVSGSTTAGFPASALEKPVTVAPNPNAICECGGEIGGVVAKFASRKWLGILSEVAELASRLVKAGCSGEPGSVGKEAAVWFMEVFWREAANEIGEVIGLEMDLAERIQESRPACDWLPDYLDAFVREQIRRGMQLTVVLTGSPVYPLVVDSSGRMAGFLQNGEKVEDVPGSQAAEFGERRVILFPGRGDAQVFVTGYAPGTMDLHVAYPGQSGRFVSADYFRVPVNAGMRAYLAPGDYGRELLIDPTGDGSAPVSRKPDQIVGLSPNEVGARTTRPQGGSWLLLLAVATGLGAIAALVLAWRRRPNRR